MTIADVVLAVVVVLTLLVVLGVMREVLILRGHVTALAQLITRPPAPSYLGEKLPRVVATRMGLVAHSEAGTPHVLLYLSKGCGGCDSLIRDTRQAIDLGQFSAADVSCIVGAGTENDETYTTAAAIGCRMIVDQDGALYGALEIRGTPTQVAMWADTSEAFDYHLGGDAQWIRERLMDRRVSTTEARPRTKAGATST